MEQKQQPGGLPPILQDDFGVPTVFAIDRAARWMKSNGYKDRVSLIASGGIKTPWRCPKGKGPRGGCLPNRGLSH